MANFNTYQTRNFYVVKDFSETLDTPGDIGMFVTDTGEFFFKYRNEDNILTRSDLIYPKNVVSLKRTLAADMDTKLMKYTINVASSVTLANCVGRALNLTIHVRQFGSYDASDSIAVLASVVCDSANTASAAEFNKALAKAIVNAIPKLPEKPFKVFIGSTEITKETADANYPATGGLNVVQAAQKFIRGRMSAEPFELTFSSTLHGSNVDELSWAVVTPAVSDIAGNTVIPSAYALADLEYFALGERGDIYRGSLWPNNYDTKYLIDVAKAYDVVTIEYFWQGSAENVQKSPRMIQLACECTGTGSQATSDADDIYDAIAAAIAGVASS